MSEQSRFPRFVRRRVTAEPVECQIPLPEPVVEHMRLASEIIDAMMASETGARGAESNEEEPHGRPGT